MLRPSELPCVFDVDETLILKSDKPMKGYDLILDFYGKIKYGKPIERHIEFLKACHKRGYEVTVWSANGGSWAKEVVDKLELSKYVSYKCTKPLFYCDDKKADEWMNHVYIKET